MLSLQAVPFGPSVVRPSPLPPASLPTNAPTEQEVLEQMLGGPGGHPKQQRPKPPPQQPALPPALAAYLSQHTLNTELLARPEAEQLIIGLNSGTISLDNVLQQLSNPGLQPRQRDLLLSVLKLRMVGGGRPRGGGLPAPPPQLQRLSPGPQQENMMLLPQVRLHTCCLGFGSLGFLLCSLSS